IGTGAVRRISAAEIGRGESGDLLRDAEFVRRRIKRIQRLAQFRKQIPLPGELIAMRIVTADRAEKNLALHAEIGPRGDELRHHAELLGKSARRENGLERRETRERGSQQLVRRDGTAYGIGIGLLQQIMVRQRE